MAAIIRCAGSLFSSLGTPKVEPFIEGLPAAGLSALYLFETGTAGQAYAGPAIDRSGNGRDAPLWANSVARKTAGGVANVDDPVADAPNRGFGILTPVPVSRKFTAFMVHRNLYPATPAPASSMFLMPWVSSGDTPTPGAPSTTTGGVGVGDLGVTPNPDGAFHINQQNLASGTSDYPEVGLFTSTPDGAGSKVWWDGGSSTRPTLSPPGQVGAKNAWIASVVSLDADAGTILIRAFGQSLLRTALQTPAQLWADGQIARGGKHCFGALAYGTSAGALIKGEIAMAGVYSGVAKSEAEADTIIASMKARLASRIPTIL